MATSDASRPPNSAPRAATFRPCGSAGRVRRRPPHLKHVLVQDPGAEHDDAVGVDHGVVAAVQELGGLLLTVQDQGDVLPVDAERDSVPPVGTRTAGWRRRGPRGQCRGLSGRSRGTRGGSPSPCDRTPATPSPRDTPSAQDASHFSSLRRGHRLSPKFMGKPRAQALAPNGLTSGPRDRALEGTALCGPPEPHSRGQAAGEGEPVGEPWHPGPTRTLGEKLRTRKVFWHVAPSVPATRRPRWAPGLGVRPQSPGRSAWVSLFCPTPDASAPARVP